MERGFFFTLDTAIVFRVSGKDSPRYLQSRLSNDIANLALKQGCFAAALTPQGKPEALFAVYRTGESSFLLTCDGGAPEEIFQILRRYLVAEQVEIVPENSLKLLHSTKLPESISSQDSAQEGLAVILAYDELTVLSRPRTRLPGFDILSNAQQREELSNSLKDSLVCLSPEQQGCERVQAGKPMFPDEISSKRVLLESIAEGAASFRKGCYVGQEVLEKIDSHGKAPRKLISFTVDTVEELDPREPIFESTDTEAAEPKRIGELISSCRDVDSQKTFGFALVKNIDLERPQISGLPMSVIHSKIHLP